MGAFKIRPKFDVVNWKDFETDWGVKILEIKGATDENAKGYYSIAFAEENGAEVYVPNDRKVDTSSVEMRGMFVGVGALGYIEQMKAYLRGNGILHFADENKGIEFDLVYESFTPEVERYRAEGDFVQFKLNFTKNINGVIDSGFLDEYTEADLEQLKADIIAAAGTAYLAAENANEAAAAAYDAINNLDPEGILVALNGKVDKTSVVQTTGTSTTNIMSQKAVTDELNGKVSKTGNETVGGIKTFSSSPIVPTPTTEYQAATKGYVDTGLANKINKDGTNSDIDVIHFKPNTTIDLANVGDMRFNPDEQVPEIKLSGEVTGQVFLESLVKVKNSDTVQLTSGHVVYVDSAVPAMPTVKRATTADSLIAERTFAVVTEVIGTNQVGFACTQGLVRGVNTDGMIEGGILYLTTNGGYSQVVPTAPTPRVCIGIVLRAHATEGVIGVSIRVIPSMSRLSDVLGATLIDGDIYRYNGTNSRFEKFNIDAALAQKSFYPTSMTVNAGTLLQGTVADLSAVGGTDVIIQEATGANPLTTTFAFSGVTEVTAFVFYGEYLGGAMHQVYVEVYNYVSSAWDLKLIIGTEGDKKWYSAPIYNANAYLSEGNMQVRFRHIQNGVATHQLTLDYVEINSGGSGGQTNISAASVNFTPTGNLSSTNVASALAELDSEKQPLLTFGIANTNAVRIDSSSIASGHFARFTANGLEGRTASQVASDIGAISTSIIGQANGVASLDADGLVPMSQLPAGIGSDLVLGETSTTAYRGDRGKIAYDHSQIAGGTGVHISNTERTNWGATYTGLNASALTANYIQKWDGSKFVNSSISEVAGVPKIGADTIIHSGNIGSQSVNYATSAGNADTIDGLHSIDFTLSGKLINEGDWNTISLTGESGSFSARVEAGTSNPPTQGVANWSVWQQGNSFRGSQIAVGAYGGNKLFFRGSDLDTGIWRPWVEVYHSGNLTPDLTANYLPRWDGAKFVNSGIVESGGNTLVSYTSNPASYKFAVNGSGFFNGDLSATTLTEGGTGLASKYLGISAKAADSDKLNGQSASYYSVATHTHDYITFATGKNSVNTLASLPITKQSVLCTVSSATTLSLDGTLVEGLVLHIKVYNSTGSAITQPLPTSSPFESKKPDGTNVSSVTIPANGSIEISIWSLDSKYIIKTDV